MYSRQHVRLAAPVTSWLVGLAIAAGSCAKRPAQPPNPADWLVYVGTNVASETENTVFLYRLSAATGALTRVGAVPAGPSPTYLTLSAKHDRLYAVNETQTFNGQNSGSVSAFAVEPRTGSLTRLGARQPSGGASPCYLSLAPTGRAALVANYMGGNVSLLPVLADGSLAAPAATAVHQGRGPHPNQTAPHAHCIIPDPTGKLAFAVDLGADQIIGYELDAAKSRLTQRPEPAFRARPGAGPRHLVFHPEGRLAYLLNELNSTVTALAYDAAAGRFRELQTLPTLPAGYAEKNSGADLHVSPDGRFLYTSNRGHNSIAVFAIDALRGTLTPVQHVPTQGQTPRNFSLDPAGRLLLVANQSSGSLVSFRVDGQTGRLTATGHTAEVPAPMVVQMVADFTGR